MPRSQFSAVAMSCLLVALAGGTAASAAPVDVVLQANLFKDPFAASIFGFTSSPVPIQISFSFDEADALTVLAGTPVYAGRSFATDVQLLNRSSLTNFSATVGNQTFTAADLVFSTVGTSGLGYDVLLAGDLFAGGVSGGLLYLNNGTGTVQLGLLNCSSANCQIEPLGAASDFIEAGEASLADISYSAAGGTPNVSVPEPDTFALAGAGFIALCLSRLRGRRARSER